MIKNQHTATILIVDDEPTVRQLLRDCFELENYRVLEAENGAGLFERLTEERIDLITLDLSLGGENGLELARAVRAHHPIPIVMITGKGDTIDRIVGLEIGADDYISKPFHVREVLARVRAVLRRADAKPPSASPLEAARPPSDLGNRYAFDRWSLDTQRRELTSSDGPGPELTTAEFDLLMLFVTRAGRVLSRDNIMDALHGHEWSPFDRSIDSLVVRLRKKIESQPDVPRIIKTVRGVGYVMSAAVTKH